MRRERHWLPPARSKLTHTCTTDDEPLRFRILESLMFVRSVAMVVLVQVTISSGDLECRCRSHHGKDV